MVTKLGTAYVRFFGHNQKIVTGLTEADTSIHYLDLSSWVPPNTVCVLIGAVRTSGMGMLLVYPDEGGIGVAIDNAGLNTTGNPCIPVSIKNQRLMYKLSVANDVFNVYLWGYFVEYPISRLKKEG